MPRELRERVIPQLLGSVSLEGAQHLLDAERQRRRILPGDETADTVGDDVFRPSAAGRHHRRAAGERFDQHTAEGLGATRHHQERARRDDGRHFFGRLWPQKQHIFRKIQRPGQLGDLVHLASAALVMIATDQAEPQRGAALDELGHGTQQQVDTFHVMQAADVNDVILIALAGRFRKLEHGAVDPQMGNDKPRRITAVLTDQIQDEATDCGVKRRLGASFEQQTAHARILIHPRPPASMLGDDDRNAVTLTELDGDGAFGIAEVRVDHVEVKLAPQPVDVSRERPKPELRLEGVERIAGPGSKARVRDLQAEPLFTPRNAAKSADRQRAWQRRTIRYGRDDAYVTFDRDMTRPLIDPGSEQRHRRIGVVAREEQNLESPRVGSRAHGVARAFRASEEAAWLGQEMPLGIERVVELAVVVTIKMSVRELLPQKRSRLVALVERVRDRLVAHAEPVSVEIPGR